jgi:hypothetical protein
VTDTETRAPSAIPTAVHLGKDDLPYVEVGQNLNLDADGNVESVFDGPSSLEAYLLLCEAEGLPRPNVLVS